MHFSKLNFFIYILEFSFVQHFFLNFIIDLSCWTDDFNDWFNPASDLYIQTNGQLRAFIHSESEVNRNNTYISMQIKTQKLSFNRDTLPLSRKQNGKINEHKKNKYTLNQIQLYLVFTMRKILLRTKSKTTFLDGQKSYSQHRKKCMNIVFVRLNHEFRLFNAQFAWPDIENGEIQKSRKSFFIQKCNSFQNQIYFKLIYWRNSHFH